MWQNFIYLYLLINFNIGNALPKFFQIEQFKLLIRGRRAVASLPDRLWDYGVIPYEIDEAYSGWQKALFKQAMRHWSNSTCIKFVERTEEEHPNYIRFMEMTCGCCSFVGKKGNGGQIISIGRNCANFGTIVHELGHVIGFWHEHTRPDRDEHVRIIKDNIMSGQEYNFNKLKEDEVDLLGSVYDYNSIMHYAKNTFAKGPYFETIKPVEKFNNKIEIGQRIGLSAGDITQTNILYNCPKCGRTIQANSGSFLFSSYELKENCEWRFEATPGERITLNITFYKQQESKQIDNYLEIRDGYWHNNPLIGKYYGDENITNIISKKNRLVMSYIFITAKSFLKFEVNYEVLCGGELIVESESHLESPNYPEDYFSSRECTWIITVPKDFQIIMKFHTFEIENHEDCAYDFVEIRDGPFLNSPLIGKYCGFNIPQDITSSTNQLFVKFSSDDSVETNGFSAKIFRDFDECSHENHGCMQECTNTLGSYFCDCEIGYELHSDGKRCEDTCGGIVQLLNNDNNTGIITSPSFPNLYPNNKTCVWEIQSKENYKISLNFTHFDLEGNNFHSIQHCEYDKIEIYSTLTNGIKKRQGVFCGTKAPKIILSETNNLRLVFISDTNLQKTGFSLTYFAFPDQCAIANGGCEHECITTHQSRRCQCRNGFFLDKDGQKCVKGICTVETNAERGRFLTPNYPKSYPPFLNCVYNISTDVGSRIRLIFRSFDLEYHPQCLFDWVEVFDGANTNAVSLGKFCGTQRPPVLASSANHLYLLFRSDGATSGKGFKTRHVIF